MRNLHRGTLALLCLLSSLYGCELGEPARRGNGAAAAVELDRFETFSLASAEEASGWQALMMPEDVHFALDTLEQLVSGELADRGLRSLPSSSRADLVVTSLAVADGHQALTWSCVEGSWWGYWRAAWDPCEWLNALDPKPPSGSLLLGLTSEREQTVLLGAVFAGALDSPKPSREALERRIAVGLGVLWPAPNSTPERGR